MLEDNREAAPKSPGKEKQKLVRNTKKDDEEKKAEKHTKSHRAAPRAVQNYA